MNATTPIRVSLIAAAVLLLPLATQAAAMSKSDYGASKTRIEAVYKSDKAACAALAGNAKDICVEEAKGKGKVARADLEYGYTGKAADRDKLRVAKADATYAVAKERCDDMAGNAKDLCVTEAKATKTKALADAKMGNDIVKAEKTALDDKREADYKVASEKCNTLAGDTKSACEADAKARFGKN